MPGILCTLLLTVAAASEPFQAQVVLPDGRPAADALVSILGQSGAARTDAAGAFRWAPPPQPPFDVLVVLPGDVFMPPVRVESLPREGPLLIRLRAAVEETVVVTASSTPHIDAPPASATTAVGRGELEQRRPANLAEVLEAVPGAGRLEEGQSAVPVLRGMARGRTLILLDGGRVTAERRAGPSATFLDPFFLEVVEVARGFGSVAYGSDAFGGTIHARTRGATPGTAPEVAVRATAGAGMPERSLALRLARGFTEGGAVLQGRYRDTGDYESARGTVGNSSFRDGGLSARFDHEWGAGRLSFGLQSDRGKDVGKPSLDSSVVRSFYPREDSDRLTLGWDGDPRGALTRWGMQGFLGRYRLVTDRDRAATEAGPREIGRSDVDARDYGVRLGASRAAGAWRFDAGADVNGRFGLEATGSTERFATAEEPATFERELSIGNAARHDFAAFVSLEGRPARWIAPSAGLRRDHVRATNEGGHFGDRSARHGASSGFVGATLGPVSGTTLTAQAGRGFRDPTLSDRFFRGVSGRGFVTGNPDLGPERSRQVDVALRHTGRVRAALFAYHYRIDDLVERYRAGTDFFFRNRGRATLKGLEAELQAGWAGTWLELGAQVARGEGDDGAPLGDVAADGVNVTVRRAFGRVEGMARALWRSADDRAGPTEVPTPEWWTLDAGATWRIRDGLEARLFARNLLDRAYPGSADELAVLAPGRSVTVSIGATFGGGPREVPPR